MKKAEAISILATSVRPREPKDRARYDKAVKMAIEALKCSERTAETTQTDHIADIGKKVERAAETAQDVQSVDDALTLLDSIHSGGRMMYSDYCALHDAISSISVQTVIDDTVSRKAAIDALHAEIVKRRITGGANDGMLDEFDTESILRKLPSAQSEVLACGEGELSAEPEQRWIPVTERLPEEKQPVLVTDGSVFGVCEIIRTDYGLSWRDCIGYWFDFGEWDAWQSLPAPYKGGEKE